MTVKLNYTQKLQGQEKNINKKTKLQIKRLNMYQTRNV